MILLCPKNETLLIQGQQFDSVYTTIEFNIKRCNYTEPANDCYDNREVQKLGDGLMFDIPHVIIDLS